MNTIIITGNQAGDLDSTVSAIGLSRLLTLIEPDIRFIPVLKRDREKLHLNPEIPAILNYVGINPLDLDFEESEPIRKQIRHIKTGYFLVDHNEPESGIEPQRIIGIIDHHKDLGFTLKQEYPGISRRIVEPCGSCASLVSRVWQQNRFLPDRTTALLLGAAIIVDTGNFNPEWGKTTDLDRKQYAWLHSFFKEEDEQFLCSLTVIKNDLRALSPAEHLIRDYKDISGSKIRGGISSVPLSLAEFYESSRYSARSVSDFMKNRSLDFLFIMHTTQKPFKRELSLIPSPRLSPDNNLRTLLKTKLLLLEELELTILPLFTDQQQLQNTLPWFCLAQGNSKASRKTVLPLLRDILNSDLDKNL